jgi:hypothetical protein
MISGAALHGTSKAIQELRLIENLVRSDLWGKWVALAQRKALIWWQQRSVPPGVKARFTTGGAAYYGFGPRVSWRRPPYYHRKGDLERAILRRKPRTSRESGTVETRVAFGGGSLNFMTTENMRPIVGWVDKTISYTSGTGSQQSARSFTVRVPARGGPTYAAAFGNFTKDRPVLEARVSIELRRIVKKAAYTKSGSWRKAVLAPLKGAA